MAEHSLAQKLARPMLFLAALIWGTSFFIMKNTVDNVPVFFLLAFRFSIATILMALLFFRRGKYASAGMFLRGAVMGILLFAAYAIQTFGLAETSASNNAFLTAAYCVMVPFLAWLFFRQRPDLFHLLGAVLLVAGIGFLSLHSGFTVGRGDALTILGAVFYALHIICSARFAQQHDILLLTVVQFAMAAILAWASSAATHTIPAALPEGALPSLLYLAVFCSGVALLFQNIGLKHCPPTAASILLSLESVFGALFAILVGQDSLTLRAAGGFILIFVAVLSAETKFSFLRGRKHTTNEPS